MEDVLIETSALGEYVRVCALDSATGMEAVAIGPITARAAVEALAVRKLQALLTRTQNPPRAAQKQTRGRLA